MKEPWRTLLLIVLVLVAAALILMMSFQLMSPTAEASEMRVRGTVTHMGYTSGLPGGVHYAATHHGDGKPTFVRGSRLRLKKNGHYLVVRVVDTCNGPTCRMLDLSSAGFRRLFGSTSQGVGRVTVYCGRGGHKPMRICLAGEDQ